MEQQAGLFKDDTLNGISLSIQNLQHQEMETKVSNPDAPHIITKYNPLFKNLINFLDLIFSFGLKDAKKGYWPYVKKIAHLYIVEMVEKHKNATTEVKKGYIWLFLTFIENSLDAYIRMMVGNSKLLRIFYKNYALLRDAERCEILFNLLIGLETINFSIQFDDPYLDFGHDPVLRQEKIIIRVQPTALMTKHVNDTVQMQKQQPDVTIHLPGVKAAVYPDLLQAQQNLLIEESTKSSTKQCQSGDVCKDLDMDLVQHVRAKHNVQKKKVRRRSEGSLDLAEDNYIPEMMSSPEYALCMSEDEADLLVNSEGCLQMADVRPHDFSTSDPMIKSFSEGDLGYQLFLENYKREDKIVSDKHLGPMGNANQGETKENNEVLTHTGTVEDEVEEDLLCPITPVVDKIQKLNLCESDGYRFAYVSDGEDEDIGMTRTDSFDRFCRKDSCESSSSVEDTNPLAEQHRSEMLGWISD